MANLWQLHFVAHVHESMRGAMLNEMLRGKQKQGTLHSTRAAVNHAALGLKAH
jgi:hypothetical protein